MLATMFALFVPPAHAVSLVLVIGDSCVVSRVDSILIHVGFKGNAGCHREPLRARFASARALPLSDFVLCVTEDKIAQWKCWRRRDPDILHLMTGDHDTPVTAVDGGAGWGGWVGCY